MSNSTQNRKNRSVAAKMREGGFVRLRTGIFEHIAAGKMTPHDMAVYLTLHQHANWRTGFLDTTAPSIAANWGDWGSEKAAAEDSHEKTASRKRRTVQNCLKRLRERGYIKYPEGDGKRGTYRVLIDKYEPTIGALVGWSLDAAATTDLRNPVYRYVSPTPFHDVYGEEAAAQHTKPCAVHVRTTVQSVNAALYGACAVDEQSMCGGCAVRVPLLDVLEMTRNFEDESKKGQESPSSSTRRVSLRERTTTTPSFEDDDDELA